MDASMKVLVPLNIKSIEFNGVYTITLKRWRSNEIAFYFYNEYRRKTCFNARMVYANKCKKTRMVT